MVEMIVEMGPDPGVHGGPLSCKAGSMPSSSVQIAIEESVAETLNMPQIGEAIYVGRRAVAVAEQDRDSIGNGARLQLDWIALVYELFMRSALLLIVGSPAWHRF